LLLEDTFAIRRLTYWTTLLFPLVVIARTLGVSTTGRDFDSAANSFAHRVFAQIMALELSLLRRTSLPFGVALFAVARKQAFAGRDQSYSKGEPDRLQHGVFKLRSASHRRARPKGAMSFG
jgi:hypothetical protein